jgi:DNA-directed RNA polymerase subunit RPC12/RpoP
MAAGQKMCSEWGTTVFNCPRCKASFGVNDLAESNPLSCPSCGIAFSVEYKYHWVHLAAAIVFGALVAHFQGLHSIVFAGAFVIYTAISIFAIELFGFTLKLPKRFTVRAGYVQDLNIDER